MISAPGAEPARPILSPYPETLAGQALAHLESCKARSAGRFTLQLMVACRPESIQNLVASAVDTPGLWYIPFQYHGKACYKVFWGEFANKGEAEAARKSLPEPIKGIAAKIPIVDLAKALR